MVMQVHSGEFYYIGANGAVQHTIDAQWVGWYNSICRSCVPLFVMISGFFLFPVGDTATFLKKRVTRVAIPFIIWCALYAVYQYLHGDATLQDSLYNILKIPVNFGVDVGHLWFVYMLLGIYLFAPLTSQWVQTATRGNMQLYLSLWALAMSVPYIHLIFPAILGECYWNNTPMLYYFSGFLGYAILANYIKRFHMQRQSSDYAVGFVLIAVGYGITAYGFEHLLPLEQYTPKLELTWGFETINVAMMTAGIFLLFKNITLNNTSSAFGRLISDIAAKSYGMYLAHIMLLNAFHSLYDPLIPTAAIKVPLLALTTFICTYLVMKCLSYLPKSKYLVG
jgi:surface polysaccharide O-acyltransferase-like enzyme